ncbi:MAG: FtsK/SpoIIIE domain-containing protein [Isosphaeraceae bacterium]
MPESPLVQKETVALADLEALIATRAKNESETETGFRRRIEREENEYRAAARQLAGKYKVDSEALEAEYGRARQEVNQTYQRNTQATKNEYAQEKQRIDDQFKKDQRRAKKSKEEAGWQALAFFEGTRDDGIKWRRATEARWAGTIDEFHVRQDESAHLLKQCGRLAKGSPEEEAPALAAAAAAPPPVATPAQPGETPGDDAGAPEAAEQPAEDNPLTHLRAGLTLIEHELIALDSLKLPRFLQMQVFVWPFLLLGGGVAGALGTQTSIGWTGAGIAGAVAALGSGIGAWIGLAGLARPRALRHAAPLRKAVTDAEQLIEQSKDWVKNEFETKLKEFERIRADKVREAEETMTRRVAEFQQRQQKAMQEADIEYPARLEAIQKKFEEALKKVEEHYPPRIVALKEKYEKDRRELDESNRKIKEATQQLYTQAWNSLIKNWTEGMGQIDDTLGQVNEEASRRFLEWSRPELDGWKMPTEVPPGLRFGTFAVDLSQFPNGIPVDPRLKSVTTHFDLPALLPFPIQGSMLIRAADAGKDAAIVLLQSLMLRYLSSVPPGKVRFTIIDPVGLGENFAAFMHLGDYHELLVTNRIWTEASHIEQRLTDLTEHMENVIQKYLRNEFETIEEYNTMAGEVAEPFRVVVVANFPTNFNDNAIRRLVSIVSSGARCGVYALVLLDTKLQLPSGFQLKDLEGHCVNMAWKESRLQWREPNFGRYPLALDTPPDQARFSKLLHLIGNAARDANRVEVPFEFIAPKPDQYWSFDSSKGVDIPLGRAGATKLQHLKLGKGTSQHCLISGKTGSGKSTLLHALITNGALRYSPDELELYLIDFKKGVEFKVYATMELPHARVIAVESEREFGLSVLQRLDVELKQRGEIYRELGCQDLAGYREARPEVPMPRILLIVDEFQEFFIEDDKIAQEVSLLLDRLVRQGRAFGMHVHLGSQTLGGAYSLPRATLGQMAVRIALQCSEADAHLILSEDNTAARLLTRPGEAIYNDANGMVEGNNLFQVVWLPDARREIYLEKIREMARGLKRTIPPPIVFEGNLPAEVGKNPLLNELLARPDWGEAAKADHAWLGDAIAIKDPTSIVFRPQSGSNVLIVGQNDEAALAMMMMASISVAAQHAPVGPQTCRFYLLDGSPVDSALAGKLGQLASALPHPVVNVTWRNLSTTFADLAAEVESRQKASTEDQGPIYIMIYDLQRFRDLRKADDDFGYSRYDESKPVPPSKLFGDILREGPPVGVHTMVWCDSVNNLNRTFDRQGTKEFENRILFQMSANDSSTLIDMPAASKLGENRALYFSEEENRIEKFRPYGIPEPEWLEKVKQSFTTRPLPEMAGRPNGDAKAAITADSVPAGDGAADAGDGNGAPGDGNRTAPLVESHAPLGDEAEVADPTIEAL